MNIYIYFTVYNNQIHSNIEYIFSIWVSKKIGTNLLVKLYVFNMLGTSLSTLKKSTHLIFLTILELSTITISHLRIMKLGGREVLRLAEVIQLINGKAGI